MSYKLPYRLDFVVNSRNIIIFSVNTLSANCSCIFSALGSCIYSTLCCCLFSAPCSYILSALCSCIFSAPCSYIFSALGSLHI